ncbi:sensor histidine kinase [Paenibacillus daejeonensis]|uniref:sensor histidine kinase n=1 Tax=Paenibacillus daejeonensis TaxID=135193 RepID=UPI000364C460|nr:histidine kinase [Paenibacillus daejeonensis]
MKPYDDFMRHYSQQEGSDGGIFTPLLRHDQTEAEYFFYVTPIIESIGGVHFLQKTGYCSVMVNTSKLQELVENTELTPNSTLSILNSHNEIIASNRPAEHDGMADEQQWKTQGGEDVIVQRSDLELADGWSIVSRIPVRELTTDMQAIKRVSIIAGIGMTLSMMLLGYYFLNSLTRPVMGLVADMRKIGARELGYRVKVRSTNEVGALAYDINHMIENMEMMTRDIFHTQAQLYELKLSKKQAEFSALQSQINPHFLYNTLNCISSIGLEYGSREIAQITSCMSRIFRYSIKQDELVSIREEVGCVQDYMHIISIRYENRYAMEVRMDKAVAELKTPKMILQPLVENAVYHGLGSKESGEGVQVIGSFNEQGDVCFRIIDSGRGIADEALASLRAKLASAPEASESASGNSIGLSNIHARIRLLFGDAYGVSVESRLGEGTTVVVTIPSI